MALQHKSWLRRRVEGAFTKAFSRAYETVKVDPGRFLIQTRSAYGLPITSFDGVYNVDVRRLDQIADSLIRSGTKVAAAQGAGFGLGGLITIVPTWGFLPQSPRTIQKLSLIYGFEFNTDDEVVELDCSRQCRGCYISRELLERSCQQVCPE
jgi:hypothetical protein